MPELWLPQVRLLPIQQLRYTVPIGIAWPWSAARHAIHVRPEYDTMVSGTVIQLYEEKKSRYISRISRYVYGTYGTYGTG